jgi:DNA-binding NtrC family response regulator
LKTGEITVDEQHRVLLVGRQKDVIEKVTQKLEGDGHIVSGTLNDDIAIDLAASNEFDALLLGGGMSQKERANLRGEVLRRLPSIKVIQVYAPESVIISMKQAFK